MSRHDMEVFINLILSALIGIIVGVVEILMPIFNGDMAFVFLRNGLIGMAVGTTARYGCHIIVSRNIKSQGVMFGYVFLIIAVISSLPALIFGWYSGEGIALSDIIILLSIAETLGLSLTFATLKYHKQLNDKLMLKKQEISR